MHQRGGSHLGHLGAIVLTLMLTGCGGGDTQDPQQTVPAPATTAPSPEAEPTSDYPAHALVLRDTIPRSYAHRQFIAFTIGNTTSHLDVVGQDGRDTALVVTQGKRFTVDGATFQVLDVVPNQNTGGAPGGSTGQIVILPVS